MTEGRISATIIRKSLATGMHVHMPDEKDHLAALAQHKTLTQARYYRVHSEQTCCPQIKQRSSATE